MPRNRSITFALAVVLGIAASSSFVCAQDQSPAPAANSDKPKDSAATNPPAQPAQQDSGSQQPATKPANATDTPKPAAKVHHVITNEDIEAQHAQMGSGSSDIDLSNINDCDAACFIWVRNAANYYVVRNTDWKRDLLHGVEQVTDDAKWQAALYQIARLKAKFCELNQDKNDELTDGANSKNVTEEELAIDEAYDRKFEAAQSALNTAYASADAVMRTYSGITVVFMNMQKQRAGYRVCLIRYPVLYRGYRMPLDDPDHP